MAHQHEEWPRVRAQSQRSWSHGICIGHCGLQLWNPEPGMAGSRASRCPEVAWKSRRKQVLLTRVMDESGNKWRSETLADFARPSKLLLNARVEETFLLHYFRVSPREIYNAKEWLEQNAHQRKRTHRTREPSEIRPHDLRSVIYLSPGTAVTDLWSGLVIHVTWGVGLPCAEQPNWEPVVFEKTRVLGGSRTKTGPCWPSVSFTLHPKTKAVPLVNAVTPSSVSSRYLRNVDRLDVHGRWLDGWINLARANLYCLSST